MDYEKVRTMKTPAYWTEALFGNQSESRMNEIRQIQEDAIGTKDKNDLPFDQSELNAIFEMVNVLADPLDAKERITDEMDMDEEELLRILDKVKTYMAGPAGDH